MSESDLSALERENAVLKAELASLKIQLEGVNKVGAG